MILCCCPKCPRLEFVVYRALGFCLSNILNLHNFDFERRPEEGGKEREGGRHFQESCLAGTLEKAVMAPSGKYEMREESGKTSFRFSRNTGSHLDSCVVSCLSNQNVESIINNCSSYSQFKETNLFYINILRKNTYLLYSIISTSIWG